MFLIFTGLKKVRKLRLFGKIELPLWMHLVVELESLISVREVLLRLIFDSTIDFDSIEKLGALASVCHHRRLIGFKSLVMPCFFG